MKQTLALGLLIAAISTPAFATTMATGNPPSPAVGDHMPPPPPEGDMKGPMGKGMPPHIERMWKEMDSNSDGAISAQESADFGKRKFEERDTNKDGKVTREEWDGFHKARMEERREKMGKKGDMPSPMDGKPPAEKIGAPVEKK